MTDTNYTVYDLKFPNGKHYIGLTKQKPAARWGRNGSGYKSQPVYKYIKQYGWDNIEHNILASGLSMEEGRQTEKDYIWRFNSIENGYNSADGGGTGSEAQRSFRYNGKLLTSDDIAMMSNKGITGHDITTRVNHHGWSLEKAMNQPKIEKRMKFMYKGEWYSINELYEQRLCKELTCDQVRSRIVDHKWQVERAISQPLGVKMQPHGIGDRKYEYNGAMYNSYELAQMSTVENLTVFDITNRINQHGWSVERAITQPKRKSRIKKV